MGDEVLEAAGAYGDFSDTCSYHRLHTGMAAMALKNMRVTDERVMLPFPDLMIAGRFCTEMSHYAEALYRRYETKVVTIEFPVLRRMEDAPRIEKFVTAQIKENHRLYWDSWLPWAFLGRVIRLLAPYGAVPICGRYPWEFFPIPEDINPDADDIIHEWVRIYYTGQKIAFYDGARECMDIALKKAELKLDELCYIISTGYGRVRVSFADREVTEITCHGKAANYIFPEAHTIIDVGGQDSKVIQVDEKGRVLNFVMNDKCAAGTGRFLEVMATSLDVSLDELSEFSFHSKEKVEVSSVCTVFAESEVISLIASGYKKADIAAAIHRAIARRITGMVGQLDVREKVAMTGGVAMSKGIMHALEDKLKTSILVPEEPQIVGAWGAAMIALKQKNY